MTDVTDATFSTDVLERSKTVPIVVDLWAPWCGPCRQLGPIIEKVVGATDGKVELVKVNVDENPQISQAFQVQGIPAVFAISEGEVVDQFVGAHGEDFVSDFVAKLVPTVEESEVETLIEDGDEASLRRALELEPDEPRAIVALAELLVGAGNTDEALQLLATVPETPETRHVAALARAGGEAPTADEIERTMAELLPNVRADEVARQQYVDLLELLGPDDPRTAEFRKRLTSALF